MICCGVPRTLPSGPELSKTRLTIFPSVRWRFDLLRERDFDDLISLSVYVPELSGFQEGLDGEGGNGGITATYRSARLEPCKAHFAPVRHLLCQADCAEAQRPRHAAE